jgi:hypothetical protein
MSTDKCQINQKTKKSKEMFNKLKLSNKDLFASLDREYKRIYVLRKDEVIDEIGHLHIMDRSEKINEKVDTMLRQYEKELKIFDKKPFKIKLKKQSQLVNLKSSKKWTSPMNDRMRITSFNVEELEKYMKKNNKMSDSIENNLNTQSTQNYLPLKHSKVNSMSNLEFLNKVMSDNQNKVTHLNNNYYTMSMTNNIITSGGLNDTTNTRTYNNQKSNALQHSNHKKKKIINLKINTIIQPQNTPNKNNYINIVNSNSQNNINSMRTDVSMKILFPSSSASAKNVTNNQQSNKQLGNDSDRLLLPVRPFMNSDRTMNRLHKKQLKNEKQIKKSKKIIKLMDQFEKLDREKLNDRLKKAEYYEMTSPFLRKHVYAESCSSRKISQGVQSTNYFSVKNLFKKGIGNEEKIFHEDPNMLSIVNSCKQQLKTSQRICKSAISQNKKSKSKIDKSIEFANLGKDYHFINQLKKEALKYNSKTGVFIYGTKSGYKQPNEERLHGTLYNVKKH